MEKRKPHKHPYTDYMARAQFYGPRNPKNPPVANEPPDWLYWNRKRNVSLDEAICLTLNFDPKSYYSDSSHSWRYSDLQDYAESSILDASLQFQNKFTSKKFRAVDWLQWLKMLKISAPDEWHPVGSNHEDESSEIANVIDARLKPNYDEAVDIAIAMAESEILPTPTTLKQLFGYMENNPKLCPVNYGSGKKPKIATVEKNVRSGGGHPLKDPRFRDVCAQNS